MRSSDRLRSRGDRHPYRYVRGWRRVACDLLARRRGCDRIPHAFSPARAAWLWQEFCDPDKAQIKTRPPRPERGVAPALAPRAEDHRGRCIRARASLARYPRGASELVFLRLNADSRCRRRNPRMEIRPSPHAAPSGQGIGTSTKWLTGERIGTGAKRDARARRLRCGDRRARWQLSDPGRDRATRCYGLAMQIWP